MPCEAPTIRLSEPQREVLESITRRGTNPQQLVRRARIILLSDKDLTNAAISEQMGYERHQVGCWRSRWSAEAKCLTAAETEESPKAFAAMVEEVLSNAPRPGVLPRKDEVYGRAGHSDRSGGLRRSRELRSSGHPLDTYGVGIRSDQARDCRLNFAPASGEVFKIRPNSNSDFRWLEPRLRSRPKSQRPYLKQSLRLHGATGYSAMAGLLIVVILIMTWGPFMVMVVIAVPISRSLVITVDKGESCESERRSVRGNDRLER